MLHFASAWKGDKQNACAVAWVSPIGRSAGSRRRTLATAGLWFQVRQWTHVAGSQMAPHPSRETWGQRAVTSIQPARPHSLTFGAFSVSYVLWPLRCKQQLHVSHLYNDSGQRQRQERIFQCLRDKRLACSSKPFLWCLRGGGWISSLLQGNGWVAYLPWPVVSPETVLSA